MSGHEGDGGEPERDAPSQIDRLKRLVDQMERDRATQTTRIRVNKRTHRIRFEDETEDSVEIVVEPKEVKDE
jgi:hypothetical protein